MVAYNFVKEFADDVAAGRKDFTIRDDRKRHAKAGERIQLYTGMRTKVCRKLVDPDPVCLYVKPIKIIAYDRIIVDGRTLTEQQTNMVIVLDGFKTKDEFYQYHNQHLKLVNKFIIRWVFL